MSEGGMARGLTARPRAAAAAAAPPLAADTNQDDLSGNEPCEHVCRPGIRRGVLMKISLKSAKSGLNGTVSPPKEALSFLF